MRLSKELPEWTLDHEARLSIAEVYGNGLERRGSKCNEKGRLLYA